MSFNGSGLFQITSTGNPVVTATVISSTWANALTADLATGLSTCITKDGQTAATARIPFAAGISSTLTTDTTSPSTGSIITAGGVGITKALTVGSALIYMGGNAATDISFRRSGTTLLVQLGDASGFAGLYAKTLQTGDSVIYMGGTTSSEVSLRRSGTTLSVRNGDDSAAGNLTCGTLTPSLLNYTFGAFSGAFNPNLYTTLSFTDGLLTSIA